MQGLRLGRAGCVTGLSQCQILGDGEHSSVRLGCKDTVFGSPSWDLGLQCTRGRILLNGGLFLSRVKIRGAVVVAAAASASSALRRSAVDEKDKLELVEPDFYRMGYIRHVRAYGIEFREGPDGIGVYSAKNLPYLEKPRVIMEVPMELMVTISKELPWMFYPNIVPMGHPVFDVINSTNPETDWDIRLACLLLLALDQKDNFWQLYGDYLPGVDDSTSLLLASEDVYKIMTSEVVALLQEELLELQDLELAQQVRQLQERAETTWQTYWPADAVLKLRRLARETGRFRWALGMALSRSFVLPITIGAHVQDAHMIIPYADMLNHSVEPNCSCRWRKKDRMLEVVINAGQTIKEGDEVIKFEFLMYCEPSQFQYALDWINVLRSFLYINHNIQMTFKYLDQCSNRSFMERYGFSTSANPWDVLKFSGNSRIHLDSFLSAFQITGMEDEYYYDEASSEEVDTFVDGAIIAAARILPTWVDKDLPYMPSTEMRSACDLQHECQQLLDAFPTTLEEDIQLLDEASEARSPRWKAAVKYRIDRKSFIKKIIRSLDIYMDRILY